jgi:hypothetical protein
MIFPTTARNLLHKAPQQTSRISARALSTDSFAFYPAGSRRAVPSPKSTTITSTRECLSYYPSKGCQQTKQVMVVESKSTSQQVSYARAYKPEHKRAVSTNYNINKDYPLSWDAVAQFFMPKNSKVAA